MYPKIKDLLTEKEEKLLHKTIEIYGWVKSIRNQKTFSFIELYDGSTIGGLQVILNEKTPQFEEIKKHLSTHCSLSVKGIIQKSPAHGQSIELVAEKIHILGKADPSTYPLQKKRHSFEFLRTIAHLRPRTNTQGAVLRVRSALSFATHEFFHKKGFLQIYTPIITGSDCEGSGEMFQVTTLKNPKEQDYGKDFFGKKTYLTVSGQLNSEALACAMGNVYTFGPTFRAENSHTSRHLAEFWMVEPEMAFCDLQESMQIAQEYLQYVIAYILEHCEKDLAFFDRFIEKDLLQKIQPLTNMSFAQMSYTEAINVLLSAKKKFAFPIEWGLDLQSEHEKYLAEEYCKKPVFLIDYPKQIKAFYMRMNDDEKTVRAMDLLVPRLGELIGGSQREERLDFLEKRIKECNLERDDYQWYLDLRRFGTVFHSGFGLGFERLIQFATGVENIRDTIPFPRYPGHAEF
jgi:asparaginyl-tRNA synthetase